MTGPVNLSPWPDNPPDQERLRIAIATALVRAGVGEDDNATELFEWHECIDRPNCNVVAYGAPCPCAGVPYLSEEVWKHLRPVLQALAGAGPREVVDDC